VHPGKKKFVAFESISINSITNSVNNQKSEALSNLAFQSDTNLNIIRLGGDAIENLSGIMPS
jgi:hypothetical protein